MGGNGTWVALMGIMFVLRVPCVKVHTLKQNNGFEHSFQDHRNPKKNPLLWFMFDQNTITPTLVDPWSGISGGPKGQVGGGQ